MKRFLVFFTVFLALQAFSYDEYTFYPQGYFTFAADNYGPYRLSGFRFNNGIITAKDGNRHVRFGTVEKLNEWTRAYVFQVEDQVLSTHRSPFLSYGTLLDCLKEYEIQDGENNVIGHIEGTFDSKAAAEFFFYNETRGLFAKATLNEAYSELIISTPDGQPLLVCKKTVRAQLYGFSSEYFWTVKKVGTSSFDTRFLWPFIAFISEVWWR